MKGKILDFDILKHHKDDEQKEIENDTVRIVFEDKYFEIQISKLEEGTITIRKMVQKHRRNEDIISWDRISVSPGASNVIHVK